MLENRGFSAVQLGEKTDYTISSTERTEYSYENQRKLESHRKPHIKLNSGCIQNVSVKEKNLKPFRRKYRKCRLPTKDKKIGDLS